MLFILIIYRHVIIYWHYFFSYLHLLKRILEMRELWYVYTSCIYYWTSPCYLLISHSLFSTPFFAYIYFIMCQYVNFHAMYRQIYSYLLWFSGGLESTRSRLMGSSKIIDAVVFTYVYVSVKITQSLQGLNRYLI